MRVHAAAEIFPMMSEDKLQELADDIRANGQRQPVLLLDGAVIDGRNRLRACEIAGVKPTTKDVAAAEVGASPTAYVISLNLKRRHLNAAQAGLVALKVEAAFAEEARERMLAGKRIEPIEEPEPVLTLRVEENEPKQDPGSNLLPGSRDNTKRSLVQAAATVGAGTKAASAMKSIAARAPEVATAVERGTITTVEDARRVAKMPEVERAAVLAKIETGETKNVKTAERVVKREERDRRTAEAPVAAPSDRYRVLLGDLAEVGAEIADESIDAIITDPPYPREFLPTYEALAKLAARVLKPGGSCVVMCGQSYLPEILALMTPSLRYHWMCAYLTPGGQAVQLWQRKVNTFWKPLLWFTRDDYRGEWIGDVTRSAVNNNDKRFHDWGQSESGMLDVIERFTAAGSLVLDPFCGAGTTGVAALALGRRFVGIDIDSAALRSTEARLSRAVAA